MTKDSNMIEMQGYKKTICEMNLCIYLTKNLEISLKLFLLQNVLFIKRKIVTIILTSFSTSCSLLEVSLISLLTITGSSLIGEAALIGEDTLTVEAALIGEATLTGEAALIGEATLTGGAALIGEATFIGESVTAVCDGLQGIASPSVTKLLSITIGSALVVIDIVGLLIGISSTVTSSSLSLSSIFSSEILVRLLEATSEPVAESSSKEITSELSETNYTIEISHFAVFLKLGLNYFFIKNSLSFCKTKP
jgi:hypothetical protein